MIAPHQIWSQDTLRAFKETLYRFMGEVHATKAALYLRAADHGWVLAGRYGFGRRDRLSASFADDHPMVRMVRAFGAEPRFYNEASELGEIGTYLREAGTSRLMLAPLTGAGGLIGFVDIRDKGGRRPFEARDLELARTIAAGLAEQVERVEAGVDRPPAASPEHDADAAPAPPVGGGDEPPALLDDAGLEDLTAGAGDLLADTRVVAVGIGLASAGSAALLVIQPAGAPAVELEPLVRHQIEAMRRESMPAPPRAAWKTEIRRTAGPSATARRPVIASALVLRGAGCSMAASVVADGDPGVARRTVERVRSRAEAAADRFRLRITRRGLARRLLQPGNRRYPELVAHSLGVSRLCWSIARVLELDDPTVERAALAGLLHDVGMRELDYDRLYLHPTPGPEDRRTYRLHVEVGDRIVRVDGFGEVADAVRHHHERWDGNGYPDRLIGESIPLLARIVHVAEVFDLFTAANSYRPAVSRERALAILERAAGHQFDPGAVEAIAKVVA
ncbi:MAG: HD domain-containing protein [Thermoanaerobaculales bacterium]|jgi:hypothetical protein|nr:HD domain-containing protein [Thermoanaerobaculales bacterium]